MLSPPRTESGVASGLTSAVCDDQSSFQRPLSCPALRRGGALGVKDVIIVSTALRAEDDWRTVSSGARSAVVSADAAPQTLSESSTCREATIGAAQRLDPLARCTRERVGSRRFYANLQVWGAIYGVVLLFCILSANLVVAPVSECTSTVVPLCLLVGGRACRRWSCEPIAPCRSAHGPSPSGGSSPCSTWRTVLVPACSHRHLRRSLRRQLHCRHHRHHRHRHRCHRHRRFCCRCRGQ